MSEYEYNILPLLRTSAGGRGWFTIQQDEFKQEKNIPVKFRGFYKFFMMVLFLPFCSQSS